MTSRAEHMALSLYSHALLNCALHKGNGFLRLKRNAKATLPSRESKGKIFGGWTLFMFDSEAEANIAAANLSISEGGKINAKGQRYVIAQAPPERSVTLRDAH